MNTTSATLTPKSAFLTFLLLTSIKWLLVPSYRSTDFDEVVGQEAIAKTLQNAIKLNRVAHAYLFCGTRGVGKSSAVQQVAQHFGVPLVDLRLTTIEPVDIRACVSAAASSAGPAAAACSAASACSSCARSRPASPENPISPNTPVAGASAIVSAKKARVPVAVCGEMAGDVRLTLEALKSAKVHAHQAFCDLDGVLHNAV